LLELEASRPRYEIEKGNGIRMPAACAMRRIQMGSTGSVPADFLLQRGAYDPDGDLASRLRAIAVLIDADVAAVVEREEASLLSSVPSDQSCDQPLTG
jgi:hypothetical protein